jgi:hypothetical protein
LFFNNFYAYFAESKVASLFGLSNLAEQRQTTVKKPSVSLKKVHSHRPKKDKIRLKQTYPDGAMSKNR